MKRLRFPVLLLAALAIGLLGTLGIYYLPPIQERVGWRIEELLARLKYALSPPEQVVFIPHSTWSSSSMAPSRSLKATSVPDQATTNIPPHASLVMPAATEILAPLPSRVQLKGFLHEYQTWNNCGPTTLAMALSYWGWKGDQRPIAAFTKPNPRDKNVMPAELAAYVQQKTRLQVISRVGGDLDVLKRFLASGLPVILEKGFEGRDFDGWMGHYVLVTGYDDASQRLTLQDSYYGPDQVMGYQRLQSYWRAFNFTYLVVYPPERGQEVVAILGPQSDEGYNYRYAADRASQDIQGLTGRDRFFAWFNLGTNRVQLRDYAGAAEAYDQAFALYPAIPEKERPWRIMWYQTGPYSAYYYSGRYQDVISLATTTLNAMSEPVLEESYYWRALARKALGDSDAAIADLQASLKYHPGFEPALAELKQMGIAP